MRLLLDTIDTKIISKYYKLGLLFGVTTNPTLAKRFGMSDDIDMIKKIRDVMPIGEIHVEAFGDNAIEIINNAKRIRHDSLDNNLVFKVPFSPSGVQAVKFLKREGLRTNLHLIFSLNQSLLSSSVDTDYICPLVGRLDDVGHDAFDNLEKIINSYKKFDHIHTKIMVSSVRHPQHVERAFMIGADVVTVPAAVLDKMFSHPLTSSGYKEFEDDIRTMQTIHESDIDNDCVVDSTTSLKDCVVHMTKYKKDSVVSCVDGETGIYTLGDFKRLMVDGDFNISEHLDEPIAKFMNFDGVSLDSSSTYEDVFSVFDNNNIRHIAILSNKNVVGVLTKEEL